MSFINFTKTELTGAIARGVRQCVVIASRQRPWHTALRSSLEATVKVFAVDEDPQSDLPATFVPTQFASEALATALKKSDFDTRTASFFIWLGGAGYRTVEAALSSLAFIASLPKGSGVVLDYAVERASLGPLQDTALDALSSRLLVAGGRVKYLIQPQAVVAMLLGLGFQQIVDLVPEGLPDCGGHLVTASV